jgi:putative transposase
VPHVRPERANVGLFDFPMPKNLKRYYGKSDLHFITFSCYRRFALLGSARARNVFIRALKEVRKKYGFALVGYVVMPNHAHLLIGEPRIGTPTTVVHSLKLRVSKRMRRGRRKQSSTQRTLPFRGEETELPQFWQKRFYDFNVYSAAKRREKLEYMHRNPVTRRLVKDPKDWVWSSYSSYSGRGTPLVEIDFID